MSVIHANDITPERISDTRTRYLAHTDHLMVVVWDFTGIQSEPDPPHHHPHEQVTFVAEGELFFFLDGEPHHLRTGDLILTGDGRHRTIDGPVVVGGWIRAESHLNSTLTINGALIFKGSGLFSPFLDEGTVTVNYDSAKGRIRELKNQTAGPAVGALHWEPRGKWAFWDAVPLDEGGLQ